MRNKKTIYFTFKHTIYTEIFKKFFMVAIVVILASSITLQAYASAISNAKSEKNKAQSSLAQQNKKISEIQQKQNQIQAEMNKLDSQLSDVLVNIQILSDEIKAKKAQLDDVNKQLVVAQQNEQTEYANMKLRIKFMYENGEASLVQTMFEAKNISDFINRIEYVKEVYQSDRDLLTQYQQTVAQVQQLQVQVASEESELEEIQASYKEQQASLQTMIDQKKTQVANFDTQLASAKTLASQYAATIEQQTSIIKQEEDKAAAAAKAAQEAAAKAAAAKAATSTTSSGTTTAGTTSTTSGTTTAGATSATGGSSSATTSSGSSSSTSSDSSGSSSGAGSSVVSYALQFVGNPYVDGGTSLTNGCDCSGYVMSVYAHFGVSLPHSSSALASSGSAVDVSNMQPGDIVCYVGHVGIYIGGGQIVNASTSKPYPVGGIKTNSATYRTIIAVRRVI